MSNVEPDAPLETLTELLFGELDLSHIKSGRERGYTRALARWYQLNLALDDKIELDYKFPACLSADHYHSFRILREWWRAEYQPAQFSLHWVLEFLDMCGEIIPEDEDEKEYLNKAIKSLQPLKWPSGDIECIEPDVPGSYNHALRTLFKYEFYWQTEEDREGEFRADLIRQYRHFGKLSAYCQQLKWSLFLESATTLDALYESRNVTWDQQERCEVDDVKGGDDAGMHLGRLHYPLVYGPPMKPCSWLPETPYGRKVDMPHFLWDREARKTIVTGDLDHAVEYTAISHTWGRWVKDEQSVQLPGVPWLVPQNTQFEVHDLSNRLKGLQCGTRYLWFDLFCIPQDRSELARTEIARQALIFRNAKRAVAWIKDVEDDFHGLTAVLQFMVYNLLRFPDSTRERLYASLLAEGAWEAVAHKSTNLLLPREEWCKNLDIRPNPWFTSLWTLQELCLRPDMWLCSADWTMLSLFQCREPLPIVGILTIWRSYNQEIYQNVDDRTFNPLGLDPFDTRSMKNPEYDGSHIAFAEFFAWITATNLDKLPTMSRIDVLSVGDKRICTSQRAEAIMSAVGATRWYNIDESQPAAQEVLVLGKYPARFVNEIKDADPGGFFGSVIKFNSPIQSAQGWEPYAATRSHGGAKDEQLSRHVEFEHLRRRHFAKGTMLPFSEHGAVFLDAVPHHTSRHETCESLTKWTIREDGSVEIPEACILAGTLIPLMEDRQILPTDFIGFLSANVPYTDGSMGGESSATDDGSKKVDLGAWAHSRSFEVHAVVTTYRIWIHEKPVSKAKIVRSTFSGVVLARLNDEMLVQLGTFTTFVKDGALPPPTKTDWIVV